MTEKLVGKPHLCTQCHYRNSTYLGRDELTAHCDHPELQPEGRDLTVTEFQAPDWCPLGRIQPLKRGLLNISKSPTVVLPETELVLALADWAARGNMTHENKPDSRAPILIVNGEQVTDLVVLDRTAEYNPAFIQESVWPESPDPWKDDRDRVEKAITLDRNDPDFNLKAREAALQYEKDFRRMVDGEFDHARKEAYVASEPEFVGKIPERRDIPVLPPPEGNHPAGWVPHEGPNGETHWYRPPPGHKELVGWVVFEGVDGRPCPHPGPECKCVCHSGRDPILHDRVCCDPCPTCGFRKVLP